LVKQELSKRYYNHYSSISQSASQPQAAVPPAPPETTPTAPDEAVHYKPAADAQVQADKESQAAASLSLDEEVAGITEVTPPKPKLSTSSKAAVELAEEITSEKTHKRKFCFIATAAYGSPLAREVVLLQKFRDRHLSRNPLGEKFIQAYYRFSPGLANQISRSQPLKQATRGLLAPIILLIKKITGQPGGPRD
jgi:hypothetical protein